MALTLARLPDGFTAGQLTGNVYNNCVAVAQLVEELYKRDDSIFYEGLPTFYEFKADPSNTLNRQSYLWINEQFSALQSMINGLISRLNNHGVAGPPMYEATALISLWQPRQLGLDTAYQNNINANWQSIEDKLNDCLSNYESMYGKE